MSDVATLIADMVRAGVDPELVGRAAAALAQNVQIVQHVQDPVAEKRRAYDRDRKAAKKLSTGIPPESTETTGTSLSPKKETSPEPPKEKTTPIRETEAREFDEVFWPAYPLKRGKPEALKAFRSARKRASLDAIMAGVHQYADERRGEDPKYTKHAQGWLNADGWTDEPAPQRQVKQATAPPRNGGVVGAAERILESKANGSESIFGGNGDAKRLSTGRSSEPGGSVADLRGGLSRQFVRGGH